MCYKRSPTDDEVRENEKRMSRDIREQHPDYVAWRDYVVNRAEQKELR